MSILDRCESRQGKTVRLLAVHSTEGNDTPRVNDAASLRDAAWWTGSSHAICDNEALLTPAEGCVPYDLAAWTLRSGNLISENIEQVGWARWTRDEWLAHPGTLENTARWLADRSKVDRGGGRRIPLVKLSPADVAAGKWGVIGHVDWTVGMKDGSHTDPGPNYPWDVVLSRAQQIVNGNQGSDIVLDNDTATQISKIMVNALTTPLIDWSGTSNANTSVLQQLRANAEGLALVYGELHAVRESVAQVSQLAGGSAASIDLKAIEDAGRKGAQSALDALTVTVSTDTKA